MTQAEAITEVACRLRQLRGLRVERQEGLRSWYTAAHELERFIGQAPLGSPFPEVLWHYLSDADIRLKDEEYRTLQEQFADKALDILDVGRMPLGDELSS